MKTFLRTVTMTTALMILPNIAMASVVSLPSPSINDDCTLIVTRADYDSLHEGLLSDAENFERDLRNELKTFNRNLLTLKRNLDEVEGKIANRQSDLDHIMEIIENEGSNSVLRNAQRITEGKINALTAEMRRLLGEIFEQTYEIHEIEKEGGKIENVWSQYWDELLKISNHESNAQAESWSCTMDRDGDLPDDADSDGDGNLDDEYINDDSGESADENFE